MNGAEMICATLDSLGARHVFGLPGTQNVILYEALRTSGMRTVTASDEAAAAFMATGYARASGEVGVLTTIPGPGFVYALAGVAEARHDSAPLLWITVRQPDDGRAFQLQQIDQQTMAGPVVKECVLIEHAGDLGQALRRAHGAALAEEPGPVLVEIAAAVFDKEVAPGNSAIVAPPPASATDIDGLSRSLAECSRPLIYAGQGAQGVTAAVQALAQRLRAPVLFTCSGRGVLPDTDPLAFVRDFSIDIGAVVPEMLERADLILALGCKFTHNGSSAGRLQLPQSKLIRVDSSAQSLAANYPARIALHARIEDVLASLSPIDNHRSDWSDAELAALRARLTTEKEQPFAHELVLAGAEGASIGAFFDALAAAAAARAVYTTDAGLHQAFVRRYAHVVRPRGLLCPSDFQSMGFGLPGAIGAALAQTDACVFACIGDGGLALSAGELLTAVREGVHLAVLVFNDGALGLIHRQQVENFGHSSGVALHCPNYAALAEAVGCSYFAVAGDLDAVARQVVQTPGVRLVELRLTNPASFHWQHAQSIIRRHVRSRVPDSLWQVLKRLLKKR